LVVVKIAERRGLRTDVSAAEGVVGVPSDRKDAVLINLDRDTTCGFAQRARGEVPR